MAATTFYPFLLSLESLSYQHPIMLFFTLLFFFTISLCFLTLLLFSLYNKRTEHRIIHGETDPSIFKNTHTETIEKTHNPHESSHTHLPHSLLLEILPSNSNSNSPKWETLFQEDKDPVTDGSVPDAGDSGVEKKKKKKRAKKKRSNSPNSKGEEDGVKGELGSKEKKQELVCMYPFTWSTSPTQRKIKQQFDQLVKCHESKGLTLAQIGEFANCLIEARHELQQKSEVIQRKFTITKALLYKADRSSFDRLNQQIYRLETEQKRLEEDAFVYNLLQQQLKLSPAYKKMLEISVRLELKAKSGEQMESADTGFSDISFEELLAQEKKDSFWQRNGKSRSCSS